MAAASVAWVTGASRGIGRAVARALAEAGHAVAATARSADDLASLQQEADERGWTLMCAACDVRAEDSVAAVHAQIAARLGEVDLLVNNAGVTRFVSFTASRTEDFDELIATNLRGPFLCTQAVLPAMLSRHAGTIVMINSMAAKEVFRDSAMYSATKAGLRFMTDCLRLETRREGVRVLSLYPGATNTDIWPDKVRERHGEKMMPPARVAEVLMSAIALPADAMIEDLFVQPAGGPL